MRLSIPKEFQEEILGDLTEEFAARRKLSERDARRWIKRDVMIAAVSFSRTGASISGVVATAVAAYLIAVIWEIVVAAPTASFAATGAANSWPAFRVLYT